MAEPRLKRTPVPNEPAPTTPSSDPFTIAAQLGVEVTRLGLAIATWPLALLPGDLRRGVNDAGRNVVSSVARLHMTAAEAAYDAIIRTLEDGETAERRSSAPVAPVTSAAPTTPAPPTPRAGDLRR